MKAITIINLDNCELTNSKTKETENKIYMILEFEKKPKELDIPSFVNRGHYENNKKA